MDKYGELIDSNTIKFTRILPGPIERVWGYLIESDKRAKWLAAGKTELAVGGLVELNFKNSDLSDLPDEPPADKYKDMPECVSFAGKVTRCEAPKLLSYTWIGKNEHSEVSFELEEQGATILLTLIHRRIDNRDDLLAISAGWHVHLDVLVDVMNCREAQPFWRSHNALEVEYEQRVSL